MLSKGVRLSPLGTQWHGGASKQPRNPQIRRYHTGKTSCLKHKRRSHPSSPANYTCTVPATALWGCGGKHPNSRAACTDSELKLEMAGAWSLMLSNTKSMQRHADAWEALGAEHQPSSWGLWAAGCSQLLLEWVLLNSTALPVAQSSSEFSFVSAKKQ